MELTGGWIKLYRQMQKHWLWEEKTQRLKWWLDILMNVNYEPQWVACGRSRRQIYCDRGQSVRSLESWAKRWGTTKNSTASFLKMLQKENMIKTENLTVTTRITVCNYDTYQGLTNGNETDDNTENKRNSVRKTNAKAAQRNNTHTIDSMSKEEKEKKKGAPPTVEDVVEYFQKNGYQEAAARKAWAHYNKLGWKDSQGRPVKNWKSKMQSVWFTEEHKGDAPASGQRVSTYVPTERDQWT